MQGGKRRLFPLLHGPGLRRLRLGCAPSRSLQAQDIFIYLPLGPGLLQKAAAFPVFHREKEGAGHAAAQLLPRLGQKRPCRRPIVRPMGVQQQRAVGVPLFPVREAAHQPHKPSIRPAGEAPFHTFLKIPPDILRPGAAKGGAGLAGGVEPLGQQGQPVQLPGGKGPDRYVHGITSTCAGPERPGSDPLIFLGL